MTVHGCKVLQIVNIVTFMGREKGRTKSNNLFFGRFLAFLHFCNKEKSKAVVQWATDTTFVVDFMVLSCIFRNFVADECTHSH